MNNYSLQKPKFIPLFKILSPHGLKGDLKVALLTTNLDLLSNIKELYLEKEWDKPLKIKSLKKGPGYNIYLLSLENLSFELAQTLKNRFLHCDRSQLPELEENEFYFYQLEGLKVIDSKKRKWGKVKAVIPMGDYQLLLIKGTKKNFYLPLVEDYVEKVDLKESIILVKDIEDLVASQG
ncbi:MAG: ribosome maturation factor RimM [Caldimicrobium sp.]